MSRIAALALNTFREAVRNKVLYILLMFALLLLALTYFFSQGALHEQLRVIRDVGLVGIEVIGALIAIFIGVNLVYKELDRKTVFALIPKPIHRWEFVLGKYAGMLVTLAVLMAIMAATLFLVLWLGAYVFGGDNDNATVLRAIVLVFGEVAVITAVAVLFSSFSSPILSGALTLGIFVVGHFTPELRELIAKVESAPLRVLLRGAVRLFPDLHLFYVSGSMVGGQVVSVHGSYIDWPYVALAGGYGALYGGCAILLAMVIFSRRSSRCASSGRRAASGGRRRQRRATASSCISAAPRACTRRAIPTADVPSTSWRRSVATMRRARCPRGANCARQSWRRARSTRRIARSSTRRTRTSPSSWPTPKSPRARSTCAKKRARGTPRGSRKTKRRRWRGRWSRSWAWQRGSAARLASSCAASATTIACARASRSRGRPASPSGWRSSSSG